MQLDYLTIIAPKYCITFNSAPNDGTTIAHNTCVTIVVQSEGRPISVTQTKSPIQIINYLPTHPLSYPPSNLNFHQLQLLHHPLPVHSVDFLNNSKLLSSTRKCCDFHDKKALVGCYDHIYAYNFHRANPNTCHTYWAEEPTWKSFMGHISLYHIYNI